METKTVGGAEGDFGSAAAFSGCTMDEQVTLLVGPIAESGNVRDFESLVKTNPCVFEDMAVRTANTPLHVAARRGHLELVEAIMDRKPGCAEELNGDGVSPLHLAAESGHVEVVMFLLSRNTRLCSLRDCHGRTPLHCAAAGGKHGVVKALIEFAGSSDYLKEVTVRGETALHLAAKNKHKRVLEILTQRLDQPQVGTQPTMRRNRMLKGLVDREGITVFQLAHSNTVYNQIIRSFMYYAEGMYNGRWNVRWYTLLGFLVAVYLDKQHMVGVMCPPIALLFLFMFFLRHIVRLLRPSVALVVFFMVFLGAIFRGRKSRSSPLISYELPLSPPVSPPPSGQLSYDPITLWARKRPSSSPPSVRISDDLDWVIIPSPTAPVTNDPVLSSRRIPGTKVISRRRRSASPRRAFPKSGRVIKYRTFTPNARDLMNLDPMLVS